MSWKVCSHRDCPELVDARHPCPTHGRPLNARWSADRNGAEHMRDARAAKRAQPWCSHCGRTDQLDYHHTGGSGIVLCNDCHAAIDNHARKR